MVSRNYIVLFGSKKLYDTGVVQKSSVRTVIVYITYSAFMTIGWLYNIGVYFTSLRLIQCQENDGSFGNYRVHHQCGQHSYKDWTESKAKVTFPSLDVHPWVLNKKPHSTLDRQRLSNSAFILDRFQHAVLLWLIELILSLLFVFWLWIFVGAWHGW